MADQPDSAALDRNHRLVIFASSLGTVFEWYDFYIYGTLAAFFSTLFFPANETYGYLASLGLFFRQRSRVTRQPLERRNGRQVVRALQVRMPVGQAAHGGFRRGLCCLGRYGERRHCHPGGQRCRPCP